MTEYYTLVREYPIACKRFVPDNGIVERVILAVHGFGGSKESGAITKLAETMLGEQTALICFDLPAHGQSEAEGDALSVKNAAADLCTMIAHTEALYPQADKTVFATSFGGFLSLLCAEKLSTWRMVLRAPAVTMPDILLPNVLRITQEQFRQLGEVVCPFARPIRLRYECYEELCACGERAMKAQRPMLILHGDGDEIVPLCDVEAYVRSHPSAQLCVIEGANHRFQADGALDRAIGYAKQYILNGWEESV